MVCGIRLPDSRIIFSSMADVLAYYISVCCVAMFISRHGRILLGWSDIGPECGLEKNGLEKHWRYRRSVLDIRADVCLRTSPA
jgi:hypothetical protein